MMKPLKNLLILLSILLPLSAYAWGVVVSSGGVAAAAPAGCSKGTTVFSEDCESDYTAGGQELDSQHSWTDVSTVAAGNFTVTSTSPLAGTYSILVNNGTDAVETNKWIQRTHTAIDSGYATIRIQFSTSDATGTTVLARWGDGSVANAAEVLVLLQITGDKIQIIDAGTWRDVGNISDNTTYVVSIQANLDASANADCLRVWFGTTESGATEISYVDGSAYAPMAGHVPAGVDRVGLTTYNGSTAGDLKIDSLLVYSGEYCATN